MLYPNMCYNVDCYKGTALYMHTWNACVVHIPAICYNVIKIND